MTSSGRFRWRLLVATPVGLLLSFSTAASADTTVTTHTPFTIALQNTCTGEVPVFSGFFHMEEHIDEQHTHTQFSVQNVKADMTTLLAPVRYVGTQASSEMVNLPTGNGASTETLENRFTLTRLGEDGSFVSGDDLHVKTLTKITTNANGVVTSTHIEGSVMCR